MQRQALERLAAQQAGNGFPSASPLPRNAMTEAESMESLASLSQLGGRSSALKHDFALLASPVKSGMMPLMAARKPRIHAVASPIGSINQRGLRKCKENENGDIFSSSLSLMSNASTAHTAVSIFQICHLALHVES